MRILQVITRADTLGGAQVHVLNLAKRLIKERHDVTVLVGQSGPFTEILAEEGVPFRSLRWLVRPISPPSDICAVMELRHHILDICPDLVAGHSSKAGWLSRIAARLTGVPVIFTAHGWTFNERRSVGGRRLYAFAERLAAPLATRIVVVSEYDKDLALRRRVCRSERMVVIHNGVPDAPGQTRELPPDVPTRLVMVGRLDDPKNPDDLLIALAGLRGAAWTLELIGDGPWEDRIRRMAADLRLADRVRILGRRSDVARLLAESHVGVLISKSEGFPLVTLEYMRAGLPVVASDVGGVREAVVDGRNGYLIPRGDVETLRERLRHLIADPGLQASLGAAGREDYVSHFTFDRMVRDTIALYREVVAQSGRGR